MTNIITMSKKELDRIPVLTKLLDKKISNGTAAKMLDLSVRQIKRLKKEFKSGADRIIHKGRGKPGHHRLPKALINQVTKLLKIEYFDFRPTHAMEKLEKNHQIKISKETVRQVMIDTGLWVPKQERLKAHYRSWRDRKDHYGEMQQYDGSEHDWFEGRLSKCTLLLSIDDATGRITHARFASDEGVINTFLFWREYLEKNGKPLNIYLDRFSTYKINIGEQKNDPNVQTQFQRAMEKNLEIKIIHANSPEAKGRVERVFETLQNRLPKEMRLAKIKTIAEANQFLTERFVPEFNRRFAVVAKRDSDVHRPVSNLEFKSLASVMSIQTPRKVNNDFTISLNGIWYQLELQQPTLVLKKDIVIVEKHLDSTMHIRKGLHYLNFMTLPERPRKVIDLPLTGLTPKPQSNWKPPVNHPWRKSFLLKPVEVSAGEKLTINAQG